MDINKIQRTLATMEMRLKLPLICSTLQVFFNQFLALLLPHQQTPLNILLVSMWKCHKVLPPQQIINKMC